VRAERGIRSESGAMIVSISPELSAQFGFQNGDVLVSINNVPIRTAEDAAGAFRALQAARRGGALQIVVERRGQYIMRQLWRG
jgi:type II secretory pathway component PulC